MKKGVKERREIVRKNKTLQSKKEKSLPESKPSPFLIPFVSGYAFTYFSKVAATAPTPLESSAK